MQKEINKLRFEQAELRVKEILEFSRDIDDKIYRMLSVSVSLSSALTLYLLQFHKTMEQQAMAAILVAIIMFIISTIILLIASRPMPYRGAGIPYHIMNSTQKTTGFYNAGYRRYERRFEHNAALNNQKADLLSIAKIFMVCVPIVSIGAYWLPLLFA